MKGILIFCVLISSVFGTSVDASPTVGIVKGHKIRISDAPFMASVQCDGVGHCCGGSIVHRQFILTAANCIKPYTSHKVLVGTSHLNKSGELYDVEKFIIHEKFLTHATFDYDIALIKLKKPLVFSPRVQKITLNDYLVRLQTGMEVNITGWGAKRVADNLANTLRQATVRTVKPEICSKGYEVLNINVTRRIVCAGGSEGADACDGDNGGPMTVGDIQVGITAFTLLCGGKPSLFTRVAPFVSWIQTILNHS